MKPKVITLCGSSRFPEAFHIANAHFSMMGYVVISLGLFGHADQPEGSKFLTSDGNENEKSKQNLDKLHFAKIDLSDEIFVINVAGYIGSSTYREIAYAKKHGKKINFMFEQTCIQCNGTGWEGHGMGGDTCGACGGKGKL